MIHAAEVVQDGIAAALEAGREGNRMCDIWAAWDGVLTRAGLSKKARSGYSIGLAYPPDWGEQTLSVREEDTTELRENMTLHFMPALWMEGWGIEITEAIRIGQRHAEPLSNVSRALVVKD